MKNKYGSRRIKVFLWHASGTLPCRGIAAARQAGNRLALLENGLKAYRATGAGLGLPTISAYWRKPAPGAGSTTRALLWMGLTLVEKNDEHFQEAELLRLRGELLLAEWAIRQWPRIAFIGRSRPLAVKKAGLCTARHHEPRASGAGRIAAAKLMKMTAAHGISRRASRS